ncbi:MAG: amidohydrolase family protein [Tepidisphaeraceae bacterium]|jgi:hypothetical protein
MNHHLSRRAFLRAAVTAAAMPAFAADAPPIIDTHQHLWDLSVLRLRWLDKASPVLRRNYLPADYREAVAGLNVVKAVYMEVDVDPAQRRAEADWVVGLCRKGDTPTVAAVIGGDPADEKLRDYLTPFRSGPVRGIRTALRPAWKDDATVVKNLRLLGEWGLSFDLVCGPAQLPVAAELAGRCPDTRFILDHCGNGSAKWFLEANRDDVDMKQARAVAGRRFANRPAQERDLQDLWRGRERGRPALGAGTLRSRGAALPGRLRPRSRDVLRQLAGGTRRRNACTMGEAPLRHRRVRPRRPAAQAVS